MIMVKILILCEEIGHFLMGSTIVLIFQANSNFEFFVQDSDKVQQGQGIGKYNI